MRARTYRLLSDQVEAGIRGGLNKCFKRDYLQIFENRTEEAAIEEIHNYIMNAICEYFDWDDEADDV